MNARKLGLNQTDAAFIAEISERTGQRIEAGTHHPNRGEPPKDANPKDALQGVWENEPGSCGFCGVGSSIPLAEGVLRK